MKVFIAATSLRLSYGGPAYSVSRLAGMLSELGHEVGLWTPVDRHSTEARVAATTPQRILSGSLADALREFGRPDAFHDNGLWLRHNHALATESSRQRVPRVVSLRGMLEPWAINHKRWKKRAAWLLYQKRDLDRAAALHTTSEEEAANARGFGLQNLIVTIPNGVDIPSQVSARRRGGSERRVALFLGRIYPVKGLPMLIGAWAKVRPQGWRLVIAGPDESGHRAEIEKLVRRENLSDDVSFTGPVDGPEKAELWGRADLFILPSHSESFGMAIAEALAHGIPVLTTTRAPWPQLEEFQCGWRAQPDVDDITKHLNGATRLQSEVLREMGKRGRGLVESQFDWEKIARQFVGVYKSLIAAR